MVILEGVGGYLPAGAVTFRTTKRAAIRRSTKHQLGPPRKDEKT